MLVLVHSGPWLCCALVANVWLRSGATVLDLPQRARQSVKGLARQSLVEQTLTADNFVAYYEVRTLTMNCGSLMITHTFVLCRLIMMPLPIFNTQPHSGSGNERGERASIVTES